MSRYLQRDKLRRYRDSRPPAGGLVKILLVDQYPDVGGGQTVFLQAIRSFRERNIDVKAAIPLGGSLESAIRSEWGDRVECIDLPEPRLTSGRKTVTDVFRLVGHGAELFRLRPLLREFDYVWVNGARLFPIFAVMALVSRSRVIYHVHLDHGLLERTIVGALLVHPRTHAVVACSEFVRRGLRSTLGPLGSSRKLRLVENTLSRSVSAGNFVDRWAARSPRQAVVIGRIIPEKGQDIVVDLARNYPQVTFHLIGDADPSRPGFAEELRARAGSNVVFHGRVANVRERLDALGVCINLVPARRAESFGLAAIEGMACSCLTVTSGAGGLEDIASQTGAWTAKSPAEWRAALDRILSSPSSDMAAVARDQYTRTLARYNADRFEHELMNIVESPR